MGAKLDSSGDQNLVAVHSKKVSRIEDAAFLLPPRPLTITGRPARRVYTGTYDIGSTAGVVHSGRGFET